MRKPLSKKIRFEVFKRDLFTCQYCGRKSPDIVLEVDHIKPVASGGVNDIINLITSCFECNSGKGKTELSDNCALNKQREQVVKIAERRRQIEMFLEWRDSLIDIDNEIAKKLKTEVERLLWQNQFQGNDGMLNTCRSLIKKYGFDKCHSAIDSAQKYLKWDWDQITRESAEIAFNKLARIIYWNDVYESNPEVLVINRAVAYATKVFDNYGDSRSLRHNITVAVERGFDFDRLACIARESKNCNKFIDAIQEAVNDLSKD